MSAAACCRCGDIATRTLLAQAWCELCIDRDLPQLSVRAALEALEGLGASIGEVVRPRADYGGDDAHGVGWFDLSCPACEHTWIGRRYSACPACVARLEAESVGIMRHVGRVRPDHGPAFADCACSLCGATAVAVPCDVCPWCIQRQRGSAA